MCLYKKKEKKKRDRVSAGFTRVDPPGRPGFSGSTSRQVFTYTQTGPRPGSARRAGPGFKTVGPITTN